jgi:hypothetical protein
MNSDSLTNCPRRVKDFEDAFDNQYVEKTSFLKDFFYNWDTKNVVLKESGNKKEIKKYCIPRKLHKWPTKPTKGIFYPIHFNENEEEQEILEYDCATDSEDERENDEDL